MRNSFQPKLTNLNIAFPLFMVLAIWFVFWAEIKWDISLKHFGVYPRSTDGLKGVFFSPFIHGDISHLWHNTLPLLILSFALFYFYAKQSVKVFCIGFVATGTLTWLIGRESFHIGASGIIYMLFGFLLFKGLLTKYVPLLALSFFVIFVYGGMLWYIAPVDIKISWEGHLSGFMVGFFLAFFQKDSHYNTSFTYDWENPAFDYDRDSFMKCFDEDGKFIPTSASIEIENQDNKLDDNPLLKSKLIRMLSQKVITTKINKVPSTKISLTNFNL